MAYRNSLAPEQLRSLQSEIFPLTEGFDLVSDHVVITDADANILYANKGVTNATGFSNDEIIGKTPGDLWGGAMDKDEYEWMWHIIKDKKEPYIGEVKNRRRDGSFYWQEIRIFPILDDNGEVKFFIGIEPDITVRKVFARHAEQYVEELERLNRYMEGREVRIKELTEEVTNLKEQLQKKL